jgi:secreted trypsin-like serine protease
MARYAVIAGTACLALGALSACARSASDTASSVEDAVVALIAGEDHSVRCSGTLIARRVVLTAAHCPRPLSVAFGRDPSAATSVPAVDMVIHPGFNRFTLADDVAVVLLAADAPVPPAPIADTPDGVSVGSTIRIAGFGQMPRVNDPPALHSGTMKVATTTLTTVHAIPAPSCACARDSGGAASYEGKLVGVISSGDVQCRAVTVVRQIGAYRGFIDSAIASMVGSQ